MEKKKKYESRKKATNKWNKENTKTYTVKCYRKTDAEIIDYMESIKNRSAYLKMLIINDMQKARSADPDQEGCKNLEINKKSDLPDK